MVKHLRRDEELRHRDVLERHRVVLADPELVDTEFIGADDQLHVLVLALCERLGGIMERHDEDVGFDGDMG